MSWSWVDTEYSIHRVQACTEYSIHRVQHTPSTVYTEYSIHRVQHTPSTAYTEYSIHQVQHTPSTAYTEIQYTPKYSIHQSTASTQHCLSFIRSDDYKLTPERNVRFWCATLHDWPPSARYPWELNCKFTLSHSHGWEVTNWWPESQCLARGPSTTSKYTSQLARLRHRSLHDSSLQLHLQPCLITASKFTRSQPPSASPNSLDHSLQVFLYTRTITASKFAPSWPNNVCPHSLDHDLGVHL